MSMSNSRLSYGDCFEIMDAALEEKRGKRIPFDDYGQVMNFRLRMHHARAIDRADNKSIYDDPSHPMHGRSLYDRLIMRVKPIGDRYYLYIEKVERQDLTIESLEEEDATETG